MSRKYNKNKEFTNKDFTNKDFTNNEFTSNEIIEEKVSTKKETNPEVTYTVTVERLNVRKESNLSSDVLNILNKGETVTGIKKGRWIKLSTEGYVMAKFVK